MIQVERNNMYYTNNANNRVLYYINFFNEGYQSCVAENLLQYVYHTSRAGFPLYRRAKKYFKFKHMIDSYRSYDNLPHHINATGSPNRSGIPLYFMARGKYESRSSIFSYGVNNKRMSFNYMGYRYDHGMAQVEDFNNVNFVKYQL